MPEIPEHPRNEGPHPTATTDHRDGFRLGLVRKLRPQRRLVIPARSHEHAEHGLDLTAGQAHGFGAFATVLEDLPLALHIADTKAMLAFVRGDLADERHAAHDDLEQVAVEHVDHGAEHWKRARGSVVDHANKLLANRHPRRPRS